MLPYRAAARRYSAQSLDSYRIDYLTGYLLPGSLTTFVLPGALLGKPDPTREIIAVTLARNGSITGRTLSSASLMGTPGVIDGTQTNIGGSTCSCTRFPSRHLASSGELSLTYSGSVADYVVLGIFRVANRAAYNLGASDRSGDSSAVGGTSVSAISTTIKPRGFLVGIGGHINNSPNSVTGADLKADFNHASTTSTIALALRPPVDLSVTPTVTWSWTGSANNICETWAFDFAP